MKTDKIWAQKIVTSGEAEFCVLWKYEPRLVIKNIAIKLGEELKQLLFGEEI
jgi:hypothetical protein